MSGGRGQQRQWQHQNRSKSWSELTAAANPQQGLPAVPRFKAVAPGQQESTAPTEEDFPAELQPAGHGPRPLPLPAWRRQPHQQRQQTQQQQQQQEQQLSVNPLAEALWMQHSWADPELIAAVLEAAGQDAAAAAAVLADMQGHPHDSQQPCHSAQQPQRNCSSQEAHSAFQPAHQKQQQQAQGSTEAVAELLLMQHSWAGSELVAAVLEAVQQDTAAAAAVLFDMLLPDSHHHPRRQQQTAVAAAGGGAPISKPGSQEHLCSNSGGGGAASEGEDDDGEEETQQDPYYQFRRQALHLTRRWQRAGRAAAVAYSSGDHSAARLRAAEAQRLRQRSLAAHAEAAERIETHNNQHNSLFELDLHGLHAVEATSALDRRLVLLHTLLADPATAAAAAAACGTSSAIRRQLRVVVGRGAHSSGGEASLPRVVENHLKAAGHRYQHRLGAIDVMLRAPAALSASAAQGQGL